MDHKGTQMAIGREEIGAGWPHLRSLRDLRHQQHDCLLPSCRIEVEEPHCHAMMGAACYVYENASRTPPLRHSHVPLVRALRTRAWGRVSFPAVLERF